MARGDHVYFYCLGYSHHGIDLGDDQFIHFDYHPWQSLNRRMTQSKPAIRIASREQFSQERPIVVREYDACDDVETVLNRAHEKLGEAGYHLFENNCEHFAVWCKTGRHYSTQVDDFLDATRPMSATLPSAAILFRSARRLPPRLRTMAYGAAFAMTAGTFAQRYLHHRRRRSARRES